MTEKDDSNFLPLVEEADLALMLFSDITDPTHLERWEQFTKSQPILAKEILKRAYITSEPSLGSLAVQKVILDAVPLLIHRLRWLLEEKEVILLRLSTMSTS